MKHLFINARVFGNGGSELSFWRWNWHLPWKCWWPFTILSDGVITYKTHYASPPSWKPCISYTSVLAESFHKSWNNIHLQYIIILLLYQLTEIYLSRSCQDIHPFACICQFVIGGRMKFKQINVFQISATKVWVWSTWWHEFCVRILVLVNCGGRQSW